MLYIRKDHAPQELIADRATPGSDFDGLRKEPIRRALLEEQGYLCAYCMCRIEDTYQSTKIEHYKPRSGYPGLQMDYGNMLAVCHGGEGGDPAHYTCDTKKGDQELRINPQEPSHMKTIRYYDDGRIDSTNEDFQKDIRTLNLNDTGLIGRRVAALNTLKEEIHDMFKERKATQRGLEKMMQHIESKWPKIPFCGILLWYLRKKLAVRRNK